MALARELGNLARLEKQAGDLKGYLNTSKIQSVHALESGLTAREIGNLHENMLRTEEAIDGALEKVEQGKETVENARGELVEKRRDERAIELYRERRFKAWVKDYHRDESKTLDDLSTIRHVRDMEN